VLNALRECDKGISVEQFTASRGLEEGRAINSLLAAIDRASIKVNGKPPEKSEVGTLLRMIYVEVFDFEKGRGCERDAMTEMVRNVLANPSDAGRAWHVLENRFTRADARGIPLTATALRNAFASEKITLKAPPDYSVDVERLRETTERNQQRLAEHAQLRFGLDQANTIHVNRSPELDALDGAITGGSSTGHVLITGEPGSGKSGLVHSLVERLKTRQSPVVLLLAEEIIGRDWRGGGNLPGLDHSLDDILAHWPDGRPGYLITDALDAVRDMETQKMLRRLLRDVKEGQSGWTVVASVREFDLEFGRELRELFPGAGVEGYATKRFETTAHFHVPRLSDAQLDSLIVQRAEIKPFIDSARASNKSEDLHRSPFYLRLAAELLGSGESAGRVADWNSPAVLLRRFWEVRVTEGLGAQECAITLRAICGKMVDLRSMTLSTTEVQLGKTELEGIRELRSRGILETPVQSHGSRVGDDNIRFTHHLLHDYAIAATLIPRSKERFPPFISKDPLFPILYRQSVMFALEELWDLDPDNGRASFWETALALENMPQLNGITRILAPILAARRVSLPQDLRPLLDALRFPSAADDASLKALQHLASGLQDASDETVRSGAVAWSASAQNLSDLLGAKPRSLEFSLNHILARLSKLIPFAEIDTTLALNYASRRLLAHHLARPVKEGLRYSGITALELICKTFTAAPAESGNALMAVMEPERLKQFPHDDLNDLADRLKYLGAAGREIVVCLFEAAFTEGPKPGEWEQFGHSLIMGMRIQTADQWNGIQYSLAGYYESLNGSDAEMMTRIACTAWNSASRGHQGEARSNAQVIGRINFRGVECELVEDFSHIWGRGYEHNENRILTHFEHALRQWATTDDRVKIDESLDEFAKRNRTSLMWTVFLEAGAESPHYLGTALGEVLTESRFLTHPDYVFGGARLLESLHKVGNRDQRERLEKLILNLPNTVRMPRPSDPELTAQWLIRAQNRLLGVLEDRNIVLPEIVQLKKERQEKEALPPVERPTGPRVFSRRISDREAIESRGVSFSDPSNEEMFRLRESLKTLLNRQNQKVTLGDIEGKWSLIEQAEVTLENHHGNHADMAEDLWGHLVGACEAIVGIAEWDAKDSRWGTLRRILLKASTDPNPETDEGGIASDEGMMSWGWPAPRIDAARGLLFLVLRVGSADSEVTEALRRLCVDGSVPLRFNLAERLTLLFEPAPDLMWELLGRFVAEERSFSVLTGVIESLDRLWSVDATRILGYLNTLATRAASAVPEHNIHEMLGNSHFFHYLRTGEAASEAFVISLVSEVSTARGSKVIQHLIHGCRAGGWMTIGDAIDPDPEGDRVRARVWRFLGMLLTEAQAKVRNLNAELLRFGPGVSREDEKVKVLLEPRDRALQIVDGISMQLYFGSGAFEQKKPDGVRLSPGQLHRYWKEGAPLFRMLAEETHPHLVYHLIQTFQHLLPCAPGEIFLLAAKSIRNGSKAGFANESLAVGEVVKLVQTVLADYRDLFKSGARRETDCLEALLDVLDLFVEAGWPEARQLTHRLEEIYR